MSKGAYIGVNDVAHKIKKGYIGIDGIARKIKKAYIGIGGIARPCWSGGEVVYYGTPIELSYGRRGMGADSNSRYAIFGAGTASDEYGYLDAFDASLNQVRRTDSGTVRAKATHVGDYVVFFNTENIEAYNSSLTKFTKTLPISILYGVAAHNEKYALYGFGQTFTYQSYAPSSKVCACDTSLECINAPNLTGSTYNNGYQGCTSGGGVGKYAIFANGTSSFTCVYDDNLEVDTITPLSVTGRTYMIFAGNRDFALFTGGYVSNSSRSNVVEGYSSSLSLINTIPPLSETKSTHTAATVDEFMIIGSGMAGGGDGVITDTVDSYDSSLTKKAIQPLSEKMRVRTAASIGNYAIFTGGGYYYETTDVYTVV